MTAAVMLHRTSGPAGLGVDAYVRVDRRAAALGPHRGILAGEPDDDRAAPADRRPRSGGVRPAGDKLARTREGLRRHRSTAHRDPAPRTRRLVRHGRVLVPRHAECLGRTPAERARDRALGLVHGARHRGPARGSPARPAPARGRHARGQPAARTPRSRTSSGSRSTRSSCGSNRRSSGCGSRTAPSSRTCFAGSRRLDGIAPGITRLATVTITRAPMSADQALARSGAVR